PAPPGDGGLTRWRSRVKLYHLTAANGRDGWEVAVRLANQNSTLRKSGHSILAIEWLLWLEWRTSLAAWLSGPTSNPARRVGEMKKRSCYPSLIYT
ncbi:hypothetical protein, partial [Mesorhizobium sp. M4B.F.Ca.ET.089.01.1.1]